MFNNSNGNIEIDKQHKIVSQDNILIDPHFDVVSSGYIDHYWHNGVNFCESFFQSSRGLSWSNS